MPNTYVLERVNTLGGLLDFAADHFGDKLGGELSERAARRLALHNLHHLSPDGTDLGRGSVCGLLDLVRAALSECDGKKSKQVIIGSLDGDVCFDKGLPLADERPEFIGGKIKAVEVCQAILALNFVYPKADLAERVVLIFLEVGEGDLKNTALESVIGVL